MYVFIVHNSGAHIPEIAFYLKIVLKKKHTQKKPNKNKQTKNIFYSAD